ncbi:MAG: TonB-dependent receptor [Rhizomicrobium sp.]
MDSRCVRLLTVLLMGGTALGTLAPAFAAEVETVVVTAEKRSQDIQSVPASISALSAEDIKNAGITRFQDFAATLPNVYIDERNLRTTAISIRGIVSETNNPGIDQAVGVFVDGVYMGRPTTINTSLADIDRVEVIRGPQGTLYGKNTIAGAINVITALPGDAFDARATVDGGDYGYFLGTVSAGGPISDTVGGRISGTYERRDGFVKNTVTGTSLDDVNSLSARAAFTYKPADDLEFILRGDIAKDRTNSGAYDVLNNGALAGSPLADSNPNDRKIAENLDTVQNRDVWGTSLEANWSPGFGTLTSITAYRGFEWRNFADNDYTVLDLESSGINERQTQFSEELRFASPTGEALEYIVGLYYFNQQLDTDALATAGPDLAALIPGYPYTNPEDITITGNVGTREFSVFGQLTYNVTDALSVTAGLRYADEHKTLIHSEIADPFQILAQTQAVRAIKMPESNLSPSANVAYKIDDDLRVYASYGRGFKSGGFNAFSVTPTDDARYKPEQVDSYEVGVKSEWFDRKLLFDVSAFHMDYRNLQVNQLLNVGGLPQFVTSNAAKAVSQGVETQVTAQPYDWLGLTLGYGYLDAHFSDYRHATPADDDYTDNRLVKAPGHTLSLASQIQAPITSGLDFTWHTELTYRSRYFFDTANQYDQGPLTLVNMRIGLADSDGQWEATLWARNLFDTEYAIDRTAGAIVPGQVIQALGAPRTVGIEIRTKFW